MKLYTIAGLVLFIAVIPAAYSQITIESDDLPSGPVSFEVADAAGIDLPDYQLGGEDQVWDFSLLDAFVTSDVNYVSISETPTTYQFFFNSPFVPQYQATHAIEGDGIDLFVVSIDDFYFFYKNTAESYNIVGYGGTVNGVPIPSQTNPIDIVYDLPLSYGQTHASSSAWDVEIPSIGAYAQALERSYEVDGWGTVITPAGSFEALRVRMVTDIEDNLVVDAIGQELSFNRNSVAYQWLAPGQGIPVIEITETFGQATVRYKTDGTPITSVTQSDQPDCRIYPTIASDRLTVEGWLPGDRLDLYGLNGQLVRSFMQQSNMEVGGLPAGCYIAVIERNAQPILQEKIIVQ